MPDVREIDPRDDADWAGWFAVFQAVQEYARPGEPNWTSHEQRALALRHRLPDDGNRTGLSRQDIQLRLDEGVARLTLHLRDNTHLADLAVWVLPGARRRGLGTALLREGLRRAAADGRTHVETEIDEPGAEVPGAEVPGVAFARRHGFACGLRETRRDLALPVAPALLDELEAAARPYAEGYRIRTWRERVPQDLLADRALIERRMSTDAPIGDLPVEEEDYDGARIRDNETLNIAQGRLVFAAGAIRDGRLVAHSEVGVPRAVPQRGYQWGTLVLKGHRGHRLGMLVKIAALRELAAGSPGTTCVSTWNAETNAPMIAVNEALGFVPAGTLSSWSRTL